MSRKCAVPTPRTAAPSQRMEFIRVGVRLFARFRSLADNKLAGNKNRALCTEQTLPSTLVLVLHRYSSDG